MMNDGKEMINGFEADMEARLWAYLDGLSGETSFIVKLIAEDKTWRDKYAELLDLHTAFAGVELEQPPLRFTKNVMEEIARTQIAPAARAYINKKLIWSIAAFFLIVIIGVVLYGFSQINWQDGGNESSIGVDLSKVDFSKTFNTSLLNGFIMLAIVLALFLLDRFLHHQNRQAQESGMNSHS